MNQKLIDNIVCKVKNTKDIENSIRIAIEALGGLSDYVSKNDRVMIKPNFNSSDPPPASSDPVFISTIVKLLKEFGVSDVIVGESSMFLLSTKKVLEETGLTEAVENVGGKVAIFGESGWIDIKVDENYLKKIKLPKEIFEVDKIIYSCCLKTHRFADFSMSLKLGMGFTYPWTRIGWHIRGREEKISELNTILNPSLIFLDARKGFISGGPFRGEIVEPSLILASNDRVALDVEGIKIIQSFPNNSLNKNPWDYTQIKRATELNLGSKSENDYRLIVSK